MENFGIPYIGRQMIALRRPNGCSAEIRTGQVISWKNERGEELLFLSEKAVFEPLHSARGGISVCFPQFDSTVNVRHRRFWTVIPPSAAPADEGSVDLLLKTTRSERSEWPHKFEFRLRIVLENNGDLTMISTIKSLNDDGGDSFRFKLAYCTYLSVSDIRDVHIRGLRRCSYMDYLQRNDDVIEESDAITIESEVNRMYHHLQPTRVIKVVDHQRERGYTISRDGFPDAVVWNPWDETARRLDDFDDSEYRKMVCVGAAAVHEGIRLEPGQEWVGTQRLSVIYAADLVW